MWTVPLHRETMCLLVGPRQVRMLTVQARKSMLCFCIIPLQVLINSLLMLIFLQLSQLTILSHSMTMCKYTNL